MTTEHPRADLSAYLDGELAPHEARRVEEHLRGCTECAREIAIMQNLGGVMRTMAKGDERRSVWAGVHRRLTRPIGWILLVAGLVLWAGLAVAAWLRAELTLEWAALSAVVIGFLLLTVGIGYEQYRDWKTTRYRDVER